MIGSIIGLMLLYVVLVVTGKLFGPFYQSDDDMNRNIEIALLLVPVFMFMGGFSGVKLYKRHSKKGA